MAAKSGIYIRTSTQASPVNDIDFVLILAHLHQVGGMGTHLSREVHSRTTHVEQTNVLEFLQFAWGHDTNAFLCVTSILIKH